MKTGMHATIIISQLAVEDWYEILDANTTVADAVLDRIVHTAQRFLLTGESMRKK
ncbi:ATP-binding protein [uncultured Bacteroides sp.]|uniref:ATP-binding protein n=1 Tax=uncultured Bacteroides sp. TaxID=162156 RepID=UPI002AA5EC5A|nr:ATP-binding protein [uncultured Bacteroides sp.]